MNQNEIVKLLKRTFNKTLEKTSDKTLLDISNFILEIVKEEHIIKFILDDLNICSNKQYAFNWFFDYEEDGTVNADYVDVEITEDMVGKNLKDIMLEERENYKQIGDLHLTWWM